MSWNKHKFPYTHLKDSSENSFADYYKLWHEINSLFLHATLMHATWSTYELSSWFINSNCLACKRKLLCSKKLGNKNIFRIRLSLISSHDHHQTWCDNICTTLLNFKTYNKKVLLSNSLSFNHSNCSKKQEC